MAETTTPTTTTVSLALTFTEPGYIADPYWPEREELISIQKSSGMNRARTEANRHNALKAYLDSIGSTPDAYTELERLAGRPFYKDRDGLLIIIPRHQIAGCMVNALDVAPRPLRVVSKDSFRALVKISDLRTDKKLPDGVFKRFAVVTGAGGSGGMRLSNQRALRQNPYIENFEATGTLTYTTDVFDDLKLTDFLTFAGREVGIGACRKLGWGRFTVTARYS